MTNDLVERLRKRAEIRRQIGSRKSVQEGKPDRIADLLEEAANELEGLEGLLNQPPATVAGENFECPCLRHGDNHLE